MPCKETAAYCCALKNIIYYIIIKKNNAQGVPTRVADRERPPDMQVSCEQDNSMFGVRTQALFIDKRHQSNKVKLTKPFKITCLVVIIVIITFVQLVILFTFA